MLAPKKKRKAWRAINKNEGYKDVIQNDRLNELNTFFDNLNAKFDKAIQMAKKFHDEYKI